MNPVFANDLKLMMADFGQVATWGTYSTTGILNVATNDLVNESGYAIIRGETPTFTYPAADLPGLKARHPLVIEGATYTVQHLDLEGDGQVAVAYLEKA